MEKFNKTILRGPLPGGDRRGTPGADAGCYSLRTVSGEMSSRRALTGDSQPENDTADQTGVNKPTDITYNRYNLRSLLKNKYRKSTDIKITTDHLDSFSSSSNQSLLNSPHSSPSRSVVYLDPTDSSPSNSTISSEDVMQKACAEESASINNIRARKKWTHEMNEFIWRSYLYITTNETKTRGYLDQLHQQFAQKFPAMEVSKQRVGDQRRAILRNNLITEARREEIRQIVINESANSQHSCILSTQTQSLNNEISTTNLTQQTRLRWTDDINEAIIKTYYRITKLEQNKTAYRSQLHNSIVNMFPQISHVSEQRIADQRRVIINNKLITDQRLTEIMQEIRDEILILSDNDNNSALNSTLNTVDCMSFSQLDPMIATQQTQHELTTQTQNHCDLNNKIKQIFETTFKKFENTDPTKRPYIPKQNTSKKLATIITFINDNILDRQLDSTKDFLTIQTVIYSAAYTAAVCNGCKIREHTVLISKHKSTPSWQKRLQFKVEDLRKNIGRMLQYISGVRNRKLLERVDYIKNKYKSHSRYEEPNLTEYQILDSLKQKLSAISSRLRRYTACTLRKQQNLQYNSNEKQFYRHISTAHNNPDPTEQQLPTAEEMHTYWSHIWGNESRHNISADWIKTESQQVNCDQMTFEYIPVDVFIDVIKSTHNWKAPGTDNIHNFWYKKFTRAHPILHTHINNFIRAPNTIPHYITQGITFMIPKDSNTTNPAKYRPITCLQTIYKIITSCISRLINTHITQHNLLAEEQKGCRKYRQGCKEQLIIDSVAMKHTLNTNSELYTMYIDYQKAFDSIPHSWLIHILQNYKIHPLITTFLKTIMRQWRTKLKVKNCSGFIETDDIPINCGIFQGDALSPLWFCLALNPLSRLLNNTNAGLSFTSNNQINKLTHLMYMDDIKLYSNDIESLHELADITQMFSKDINMNFGIDKCKTFSTQKRSVTSHPYRLNTGGIVASMDQSDFYKYLGFQQAQQIAHKQTKIEIIRKFKHRLSTILKSQLDSRNIIKAINSYVVPILTYTFGIINWSKTDLIKLQRTIHTSMTTHRKHHPRSCIQRLTLPRKEGGRGLIDISNLHNRQIINLRKFFYNIAETSALHHAIVTHDNKITPLNLSDNKPQRNEVIIDNITKFAAWKEKALHGRHFHDLQQPHVDKTASNGWLQRGELFPETEAFMLAIQDQVIDTRNYQKYIIRTPNIIDTCRRCFSTTETIQHITGACKTIVQTDYKHRHDQAAAIIHQHLAYKYKLIDTKTPYYKYLPQPVLENEFYKLYWDRTIITDKTVHYNRPDITLIQKINKSVRLIDIAVCNTHNLQATHAEKIGKYTDLSIEIKTQWQINNIRTIPILVSTTGVIPKTLLSGLEDLGIPIGTYKLLQKAVILNTCRIVRKFLSLN